MTSDTPYKKQIYMDIDEEPQCNSNVNSKPYLIEVRECCKVVFSP